MIDDLLGSELIDEDTADIIRDQPRKVRVYQTFRNIVRRIDGRAKFFELISVLEKANQFVAEKLQIKNSPETFVAETEYGEI